MMSFLRTVVFGAALAVCAPAFAQETDATIRVTATGPSGRPTLMSHFADNPIPATVAGLIARLNEPGTCAKETWPAPDLRKPCAVVAYYLSDKDEAFSAPQLVFRAIYYVSHPENVADMTIWMVDVDGGLQTFSGLKLDEPLRPMRVLNSCTRRGDVNLIKKVKKCKRVSALYQPFGIIGYLENEKLQIMAGRSKEHFFSLALKPEDIRSAGLP